VHLHAAFVPPAPLITELVALVRAQEPSPPEPPRPIARRSLLGRRAVEEQPAPGPVGPLLDLLESGMWVPVTDFGFVRPAVARDLMATIARAAERYAPPRVVLSGGAALVDDDDRFVWVELKADDDSVEVMRGITREVVAVVERLGFYCDRRQFRSRIPLAAVNDRTTVEHLEALIAALDAHTSEPWTVDEMSLLQRGAGTYQKVTIGADPAG